MMDKAFARQVRVELARALSEIARADGAVRRVEVETAVAIFEALLRHAPEAMQRAPSHAAASASALAILPWGLRLKLVRLFWLLAESDGQLHAREERVIYDLADRLNLDRRTIARTQPAFSLGEPRGCLADPVSPEVLMERLAPELRA